MAVTGAARGIGLAIAQAFYAEGAAVALGDLDLEPAVEAAGELGDRAHAIQLDVTDRASFDDFLTQAEQRFGPVHILVNNAGIMPTGDFLDEPAEMTDQVLAVNLRAVLTGSQLAAQRFRAEGRPGAIVNIASLAGLSYASGVSTYCATKHAVVGASGSLAREWESDGIRVLAVLPCLVATDLSAGATRPRWGRALLEATPEKIAAGVLRALAGGGTRVAVPAGADVLLRLLDTLPYPLRRSAERLFGLDAMYGNADPHIRRKYHERLGHQLH
ncbi:SDR family NAD(P)-dependent oxidoreductase [Mycolicibacterium setense]|uniref:SDR family NAD(P)-dependent oxidoreductase n=1 Tax=Mycolicibacterium setense TaxID=431269 RepID=UPI0013F4D2D8|nr:SDR family NAD(P)-dependent oxidoreductase [Mycolicibacterium setense]